MSINLESQTFHWEARHRHMELCRSKALDSPEKEIEGMSGSLPAEDELSSGELLLSLFRVRDFISLLLSYPVKAADESMLKAWISDVSKWTVQLSTGMPIDDYGRIREQGHLLTEKLLRYIGGLTTVEKMQEIKCGGRSILKTNDAIPMPEAILHLTVELAIEQLIQTLLSGDDYVRNIHCVRLSTRNDIEKRAVMEKIEAALKDKHNVDGIDKAFCGALRIDASMYQSNVEVGVQEEIAQQLRCMTITGVETGHIDEEMVSNRYLVLLVDGNSNNKLDPRKVCSPGTKVAEIVVLVTTEPSEQGSDEFTCAVDLNIRTQDHLLPWEVFCSYVGNRIVCSSSGIRQIAVQIVEECRGHLLAIVLVAKHLKNVEDLKLWKLALDKLRYKNPSYNYQESDRIGISRVMVNAFVNIIWEDINETQKLCLELSLFVYRIKNGVLGEILISDWVSTELAHTQEAGQHLIIFDSADSKLEYTREKAEHDMRELLDRSVLLQCGRSFIRLPTETYDILESLHSSYPSFIRHGGLGLVEPPHIGRWHGLIRIELMDNNLCELPQSPNCPKLRVLLLQGNVDLTEIPYSFFDNMPLLRYLNLSYTSIRDLPPSISNLVELKKFYLRGCELFMVLPPEIGQLKNLEKLDLDGTLMTHLPKEIRELTNLQSLTVCFHGYHHQLGRGKKGKKSSNSTIIPPGLISNLAQLNYLSINVDPEDERWNENVKRIASEIFGLERLETVNIYVPKAEILQFMAAHISLDFRLVVGYHMQRFISRVPPEVEEKFKQSGHSLKFVNGESVPIEVSMVLGRSRALYLDRHITIKSLSEFQLKNLYMLQLCILAECNKMETIVDGNHLYDRHECSLPYLKFLCVFYMKNLRSICQGPPLINPSFLHSLKSMALHTCPMLTTIFTLDFLGNLSLLEELIVEDCPKVTSIISHNSPKHERQFFLPRLRMISLLYLPELLSISNGLQVGQNLEKMGIFYCPKLQSLSKTELSSKSLSVIKGEIKWWEALKWNEAEWGGAGRPNFLSLIFSPINEEANIMTQLAAHDNDNECQDSPKPHALGSASPQTDAALKVQKVYRSYRTRRLLADTAVVVEELWWKAVDFVRLRGSGISLFEKACKVGKSSLNDAKAQELALQAWIEAIDPRHRYGRNLHYYYIEWREGDAVEPFFYWLDIGSGKNLNLEQCPRSKLQRQCIQYLGPREREQYEYVVCEGKIISKQSGDFLHTKKDSEGSRWIFVMSTSKKLYAGKKKKGLFHHSSFLAGGATLAAGRLEVEHGILKSISAYCRHYWPTDEHLDTFLSHLRENGVKLDEVESCIKNRDSDIYEDFKLSERAAKSEVSSTAKISVPEISEEAENTLSSVEEDLQPRSVSSYKRTLSGGLRSPIAVVPKTVILQRIASKKVSKSYQLGHQLSCKWSTGAGPRIGCVADYPLELRILSFEMVDLLSRSSPKPSS